MNKEFITRFLNRELSDSEKQQLEDWLEQSPENRLEFEQLAKASKAGTDAVFLQKAATSKKRSLSLFWMAAAAVLLLFVVVFFPRNHTPDLNVASIKCGYKTVDFKTDENRDFSKAGIGAVLRDGELFFTSNSEDEILIKIPNGEKLNLKLTDGSYIAMNSGSEVKVPMSFPKNGSRNVYLNGEAFFDVAKDKQRPFMVKTEKFITKVLGTKFNINSYQDEKNSVSLVEGSVEVKSKTVRQKVLMKPGEILKFNDNKLPELHHGKTESSTAWLRNELIFENELLPEIFKKIEKQYGVEIKNKIPEIEKEHFTGNFKNEKLDDLLKVFEISFDCKITKSGNKITIDKN